MALIYVGCGLTDAPSEFVEEVERFKARLREKRHRVLEFVIDADPELGSIFTNDILNNVRLGDLFVAVTDYASTGLGLELGFALGKYETPTLAVARYERRVSRLLEDMTCHFPSSLYQFRRYRHMEWISDIFIPEFLKDIGVVDNQLGLDLP